MCAEDVVLSATTAVSSRSVQVKLEIARLDSADADFWEKLGGLMAREGDAGSEVESTVRAIVSDVRCRGDEAVIEYTN